VVICRYNCWHKKCLFNFLYFSFAVNCKLYDNEVPLCTKSITSTFPRRPIDVEAANLLRTCCRLAAGKLVSWILAFKALSTLSQKSATVAENGDCRRKRRDNGDSRRIRRQPHFSATVWTGFKKLLSHSLTVQMLRAIFSKQRSTLL